MRFMKVAAAAAILLAAIGGAEAKDWSKIRIGTEGAYPPFNNLTADDELVGFDIDIANALCAQMEVECEFITQDWDGMIPALQAGKFDAVIASMSITEERLEKVDFSNKYYNTPPAIAVPKDSSISEATDAALDGKLLGAQSSTTHSNYAEAKIPSAELKLYPTPDEYKLDLGSGRIDAAIDDVVVLSDWLATDDGACCKLLGTLVPDPVINGQGAGIAIRKDEPELKAMLNEAIAAIRADGTYEEIQSKYFDFDVYGG
ncbi:ABC transporter substrate-binding protein [Stappia sp. ES.058]|uniref:ABC transporter substrate-binding protein n=1 Tax=Stappia sp. ES.058 TaxID=1881061 RepID=UPI00087C2CBE|nr:ABC transporter substrate-binding protein [Stappia sp. ES.058]SDU04881.1 amino acid ABC transporter substrate-binding protein, PAAT family [Stappia sp. ES.058]